MTSAALSATSIECEFEFIPFRAVFIGERSRRLQRPFHYSLLVAIVEFGGELTVDEASAHLFPEVPPSVLRSVARELQQERLIEIHAERLVLSELGVQSLADGRLPYVERGTWSVDWIEFGGHTQILSVARSNPSPKSVSDARNELRLDEEGLVFQSLNRIRVPDSIFGAWRYSMIDNCEWRLRDPSTSAVGIRVDDRVRVSILLEDGKPARAKVESLKGAADVQLGPDLDDWMSASITKACEQIESSPHPDDLSDREVLESQYSLSFTSKAVGGETIPIRLVISGVPIFPKPEDSRIWILRVVSIYLQQVVDSAVWMGAIEYARRWNGIVEIPDELTPQEVIEDLERRGLRYSKVWWNVVSALDWDLL